MKKNVLLVEQQDNLRLLYESLLSTDFNVKIAKSSVEAFAWSKTGNIPDFIVATHSGNSNATNTFMNLLHASGILSNVPVFLLGANQDSSCIVKHRATVRMITHPSNLVAQIHQFLQDKPVTRTEPKKPAHVLEPVGL